MKNAITAEIMRLVGDKISIESAEQIADTAIEIINGRNKQIAEVIVETLTKTQAIETKP